VDPKEQRNGKELLAGVKWCSDPYVAAENADLIVLLTQWNEFRALDLARLSSVMRSAIMADYRNIYKGDYALSAGFEQYQGVGK
jgi:UDPglucose 6-dehydrogenase